MTIHGIGVDIADARRIRRLAERGGEDFARRWFGDAVADGAGAGDRARALAECFAVKEAVWKALGVRGWTGHTPWPWIEVRRDAAGAVTVALRGPVAAAALRAGAGTVNVAAHSRGHVATAFAVVERLSARRPPAPAA
jgi:holo-[acyl-carrier protein] synthase